MENRLVVKSNDLISANYTLNLNEQKMALYAISKLDKGNKTFNSIDLNIKEFIELLNITDRNYEQIRNTARGLRRKEIIIDTDRFEYITGWFSGVTFDKSNGDITIKFDDDLVPYLLKLKERFTRYELKNILSLKSAYSIRLYELLKQYEKIGKREFKLDKLKGCIGLEKEEYSRIYDFERWVLKVAKEEINKNTDISIDYEKIKTGRKITSILFKIESKDQDKEIYIDYLNEFYNIKEMKIKMGLQQENFSTDQIMSVYEKAVEKARNEDIDLFEYVRLNYNHIKANARNKFAYLLKALENDYASAIGQISLNYYIEKENN